MCPGTIALVATAATAAGDIGGGIAQGNAAAYQAQIARNNSQIARQNAAYTAEAGSSATQQAGLKARAQGASVKAGAAANNLDVSTGSPADVETSQRELGNLDAATVASRAAEQVYGYQSQASGFTAQSQLDQSEVAPDILGGFLKAGGSIAGAGSSIPDVSSLLSGPSTLPSNFQWMGGNNPALDEAWDGGNVGIVVGG